MAVSLARVAPRRVAWCRLAVTEPTSHPPPLPSAIRERCATRGDHAREKRGSDDRAVDRDAPSRVVAARPSRGSTCPCPRRSRARARPTPRRRPARRSATPARRGATPGFGMSAHRDHLSAAILGGGKRPCRAAHLDREAGRAADLLRAHAFERLPSHVLCVPVLGPVGGLLAHIVAAREREDREDHQRDHCRRHDRHFGAVLRADRQPDREGQDPAQHGEEAEPNRTRAKPRLACRRDHRLCRRGVRGDPSHVQRVGPTVPSDKNLVVSQTSRTRHS